MKKLAGIILVLFLLPSLAESQTVIAFDWAAIDTVYKTNLFSSLSPDADIDNSSNDFSDDIDFVTNGYVYGVIEVRYDASGTTDDLELSWYGGLDNTWDGDEVAIGTITLDNNAGGDTWRIFVIPIFPHVRYLFNSSGATDTFDAAVVIRLTRVDAN